jgi:hypothetical protein
LTKKGWDTFWAIFSKTHPVTLVGSLPLAVLSGLCSSKSAGEKAKAEKKKKKKKMLRHINGSKSCCHQKESERERESKRPESMAGYPRVSEREREKREGE